MPNAVGTVQLKLGR